MSLGGLGARCARSRGSSEGTDNDVKRSVHLAVDDDDDDDLDDIDHDGGDVPF